MSAERGRRFRLPTLPSISLGGRKEATATAEAGGGARAAPPATAVPIDTLHATTFAIPLPEHAEPLLLVQQLLPPGEAADVQIKYRETRR